MDDVKKREKLPKYGNLWSILSSRKIFSEEWSQGYSMIFSGSEMYTISFRL